MKAQAAGKPQTILLPGNVAISSASISAVEPTSKRADDNIYLLAGEGVPTPYGKGEVSCAPDYEHDGKKYKGGVLCKWWKKNISRHEWEEYYSKLPHYHRIDDEQKAIWVAMYLPIEKNSIMPSNLVDCSASEIAYLDGRRK